MSDAAGGTDAVGAGWCAQLSHGHSALACCRAVEVSLTSSTPGPLRITIGLYLLCKDTDGKPWTESRELCARTW